MSDKQTFYKDKPYIFVPLVKTVRREPIARRQDALKGECGVLNVTVTARSPLHFGQGVLKADYLNNRTEFIHALNRENGHIALPGSSFKGMLRSFFEAITSSCVLFCPSNPQLQWALPIMNRNICTTRDGLCPACSLFGCLGYKGKLTFSSFYTQENTKINKYIIPQLQTPFRDYPVNDPYQYGRGNERLYYGVLPSEEGTKVGNLTKAEFFNEKRNKVGSEIKFYGRKFYKHSNKQEIGNDSEGNTYECIDPDSTLTGTITYQGLQKDELAALLFSLGMGWEKPIYHKLGYAKPAYYGSVSIQVHAADNLKRYTGFGKIRDTQALVELACDYYTKAIGDVKQAIDVFEQEWTTLDKPSQWHLPQEGGQNRTY